MLFKIRNPSSGESYEFEIEGKFPVEIYVDSRLVAMSNNQGIISALVGDTEDFKKYEQARRMENARKKKAELSEKVKDMIAQFDNSVPQELRDQYEVILSCCDANNIGTKYQIVNAVFVAQRHLPQAEAWQKIIPWVTENILPGDKPFFQIRKSFATTIIKICEQTRKQGVKKTLSKPTEKIDWEKYATS